MITKETIFILGAGASAPYGYPTAKGLREFIIREFRKQYSEFLRDKRKIFEEDIKAAINKFSYLIQSFKQSSTKSFDLFLSRNKENYYDDGKFILAWCILYFEMISKFNEDIEIPETDWYTYLFNEMTSEMTKSTDLEKYKENRLKIITFNYDRSLEEFLSESLFFSFAGDRKDVTKFSDWIKVYHVYGKIYDLQWENPEQGEKYQTNNILELAEKAKNNIQIIYDERRTQIEEIQGIIASAQRIFFLGFGYSRENLEAIGITNFLTKHQYINGTALGFKNKEVSDIKNLLGKMNPALLDHHIMLDNELDCVGLLREYL